MKTKKIVSARAKQTKKTAAAAKRASPKRRAKNKPKPNNLTELLQLAKLGSAASTIRDGRNVLRVVRENVSASATDRSMLDAFEAAMRLLRDGIMGLEEVVDQQSAKFREAR